MKHGEKTLFLLKKMLNGHRTNAQKSPLCDGSKIMGTVYCGTYGKYNAGRLEGGWLNVEDYESKNDFYVACRELHKDEEDPEFLFLDWENITDGLIQESWISDLVFKTNEIRERIEIIGLDIETFSDFCDYYGFKDKETAINRFEECFICSCSLRDFAEECLEVPDHLYNYIDWDAVVRDLSYDYDEIGGAIFCKR